MQRDKRAPGNFRIQGEGDYVPGHRYQKDAEQHELAAAELRGKARAKGKTKKK